MRVEKVPGCTSGVQCDFCATVLDGDFTYYSIDAHAVDVRGNKLTAHIKSCPVVFSFDSCWQCIQNIGELVKLHYAPTAIGINCDLCGAKLRGDFTFYYLAISEVSVDMTHGTLKCAKCDAATAACKCGSSTKSVQVAKLVVNDKYLQVASCQREFDVMTAKAAELRKSISNG